MFMPLDDKFWEEFCAYHLDNEQYQKLVEARRKKTEYMSLEEYLANIRNCEDESKLLTELNIYDNFSVILYGNPEELYSKILIGFRNSTQEGNISEPWKESGKGISSIYCIYFEYKHMIEGTTPIAQLNKGSYE